MAIVRRSGVVHVLQGFNDGGVDALAALLFREFRRKGYASEILLLSGGGRRTRPPAIWGRIGLDVICLSQCDNILDLVRSCSFFVGRRRSSVVIYPFNRTLLWFSLGVRLSGVRRVFVAIQNTAPQDSAGLRTWHFLIWLFQCMGIRAVPCTQAIVDSLKPLPPGLRLGPVIPNGCDTLAIASRSDAARRKRPLGRSHRVLMVARLDPIKDQATLLRAFAAARQPGWQLQLVGDGPDRPRLEALARDLGLDPAQVFLGRRADIPELLGQADLFAFSTTASEGFGIALIEAMAAGLPVIASDVPACREVLRDGAAGDLLPPGDGAAWRQRLERLMASEAERQALAARSVAHAAQYDIRHTAQRWLELLEA